MHAFAVVALLGPALLLPLGLVHCASLDGLALSDDAGSPSSPSGAGGDAAGAGGDAAAMPGSDASAADALSALGPGQIYCASTSTACDVRTAQCCITLIGTSSMASRTYTTSSAQCGPIDGPGCGQFVGAGNDFTMKFPQRCGTAGDCAAGQSCCVLANDGTRFGKELASIKCVAAPTCAMTGRAICTGAGDCAATENCLAETDPVLSHLYAKFCQ